jgi:hypothetical protein
MAIEAARTGTNSDVVAQLVNAGERLPDAVAAAIARHGREVVPSLVEVLEEAPQAEEAGAASEPEMNRWHGHCAGTGSQAGAAGPGEKG